MVAAPSIKKVPRKTYTHKSTHAQTDIDTEQRSHKLQSLCVFGPVEMNKARLSIMLPPPPPPRTDTYFSWLNKKCQKWGERLWVILLSHRRLLRLFSLSAASRSYVGIYVSFFHYMYINQWYGCQLHVQHVFFFLLTNWLSNTVGDFSY